MADDSQKTRYIQHLEFETSHRKKWLTKPVLTKRYIRAIIKNYVKEKIRSRDNGDMTTDPEIRARCLMKTGGTCYLCFRIYTTDIEKAKQLPSVYFAKLQIDHVVPFSKGGPNDISNYMPCCSRCNNKKSDLSLAEYRAGVRKPRWRR